jgi:hypothetical protein
MILSRVWYVLLGAAVVVALYALYVAVGQFNRTTTHSLAEGLASDSQTVEWKLKIDSRRRLDGLLGGAVDPTLQGALVAASTAKDGKIPQKSRDDAKKALSSLGTALADPKAGNLPETLPDVLFAVDRDGRVVAYVTGPNAKDFSAPDDFELGGYPAVFDALHGWLRDDAWLWGSKMYFVVARPVEFDVTQRPAGAIVGLKEVNEGFAKNIADNTRSSIAFYANGQRIAAASSVDGFDTEKLDAVPSELPKLASDESYTKPDTARSDVHWLTDDVGAMYARLPGDVWSLGGGFAVVRAKTSLMSPYGFLSGADKKDAQNVPWWLLITVVLVAGIFGIGFTVLEHTLPLRELVMQATRFRTGAMDRLQVARFRGSYRLAAQFVNEGIDSAIEKSGGQTRKPADLEQILGPAPAQPAMSAFAFPPPDGGMSPVPPTPGPPASSSQSHSGPRPMPQHGPQQPMHHPPQPQYHAQPQQQHQAPPPQQQHHAPPPAQFAPPPAQHAPPAHRQGPPAFEAPPTVPFAGPPPGGAVPPPPQTSPMLASQTPFTPIMPNPAAAGFPAGASQRQAPAPQPAVGAHAPAHTPPAVQARPPPPSGSGARAAPASSGASGGEDEDATMVGNVPAEVMAQATGENRRADEAAEWLTVYDDFIRTKKQCGEATDGLTFEKFSHTLKKNRDQLIARHGCKKVKFSVYVKEGRASLKATPIKE